MNSIVIHRQTDGIPYAHAPAGSFCEILDASDESLIGCLCVKPYMTNQSVVLLNKQRGSTDRTLGILRVRPLQEGDSFTVVIGKQRVDD